MVSTTKSSTGALIVLLNRAASLARSYGRKLRSRLPRSFDFRSTYLAEKYRGLRVGLRRRLTLRNTTFIAVTGSAGKTTTAKMVCEVLSSRGACHTMGGRNSVYASTLCVLSADHSANFCVQETGADEPGTIAKHVRVLRPEIGIVTTIGSDHYKNFRSLEATAREKGQLVESLPRHGVAILNADDPHVRAMAARTRARVVTFGRSLDADVTARGVSSAWPDRLQLTVVHGDQIADVRTLLVGEHWTTSVLAAIACGLACGLDLKTCANAISRCQPVFGRYSVHEGEQSPSFVLDHNKAPLWTIPSGLAFVNAARAPRKTIVFGTISDYAGSASSRYRKVAREALQVAERVVFVGPQSGHVGKLRDGLIRERLFNFTTAYQASAFLANDMMPGELIYIKASITDHLERIMLSQLSQVVCWRERCGVRRKSCPHCPRFRKPSPPPFGVGKIAFEAHPR